MPFGVVLSTGDAPLTSRSLPGDHGSTCDSGTGADVFGEPTRPVRVLALMSHRQGPHVYDQRLFSLSQPAPRSTRADTRSVTHARARLHQQVVGGHQVTLRHLLPDASASSSILTERPHCCFGSVQ